MAQHDDKNRHNLYAIADRIMFEKGMASAFPLRARHEAEDLLEPAWSSFSGDGVQDLTALLWSSIDNDDSRDLDQLEVVDRAGEHFRLRVAIADVISLVKPDSAIDKAARDNTTSVYTGVKTYPMLPERLSYDLTSLLPDKPRLAVVVETLISASGRIVDSQIFRASVRNKAKLAYAQVAAWLEGQGQEPEPLTRIEELKDQLRLQEELSGVLRQTRMEAGALEFETRETWVSMNPDGTVKDIKAHHPNRAEKIIEEFMIATNQVTAKYLARKGYPTLRRVVKNPERWDRIVELAREYQFKLPPAPESLALSRFLAVARKIKPELFQDLSLAIIKLIGRGEYKVLQAGKVPEGHFGLALRDYSHSTAPNRRYPDIITQRLLQAALKSERTAPYSVQELDTLARHCTLQEDAANKVERQVKKCAAAELLGDRIGEIFEGMVTGSAEKGTWVKLQEPPVEGKLLFDGQQVKVGDRIRVKLIDTDVERGFIDLKRI